MKSSFRWILSACLGAAIAVPATAGAQVRPLPDRVRGEAIVQFETGARATARGNARRAADVSVVRAMRTRGRQLVRV